MAARITEFVQNFSQLPDEGLVSTNDVAALLGMSTSTVWRLGQAGKLTPLHPTGRATRFRVGEVRKLLAA
jgi:predicted DNA-binding transcriptional regulator AlpA